MDGKQTGWEHFADADWAAARDAFAAALEGDPGDPEALDGLGQSLWWLGERDAAIDRRRGGVAGHQAGAAGGLSGARRLLAGEGTFPEVGWWAIEGAKGAEDATAAEHHAR